MLFPGDEKYNKLFEFLRRSDSLAIAFSGGVDSTFLLAAAADALPGKVHAFTVKTEYIPDWEVQESIETASLLKVPHILLNLPTPDSIKYNPPDRCYHCKKALFTRLWKETRRRGIVSLADGTNADDLLEVRPGRKALEELGVISPLLEAGLGKEDIHRYSGILQLPTAQKPAYACLLTRLPYQTRFTGNMLRQIEQAEVFLHQLGFRDVRVRHHDTIARIEVPPGDIIRITESKTATLISEYLKKLGYLYVTADLVGYRKPSERTDKV